MDFQYACFINAALSDSSQKEFALLRPHHGELIQKQLGQLAAKDDKYRSAHIAYMISKLRPFGELNEITSALLLVDSGAQQSISRALDLLRSGAKVAQLSDAA